MNNSFLYEHILGGLAAALIGDAMGAATEFYRGPEQIREHFGRRVTTFCDPAPFTPASRRGRRAGQITDDTSQLLYMVQAYALSGRVLRIEHVAQQIVEWSKDEVLFNSFAGPSTRKAIQELKSGKSPYETGLPVLPSGLLLGSSNGAAMKVAPAGMAHPGDLDAAILDAITMSTPTHHTGVAFAGAAATAAAVAAGLVPGATLLSVTDAAIYGAQKGYEAGKDKPPYGRMPMMVDRIQLAIEIGAPEPSFETACERLADVLGCGLPILEAVPVAVGLFVAARGDPNLAVIGAANIGGDTDTVGAIVGSITGAYAGINAVDPDLYHKVVEANEVDLPALARQLIGLSG